MAPLLKPSECAVLFLERFADDSVSAESDAVATGRSRILQAATLCTLPALFAAPVAAATLGATPIHNLQPAANSWAESTLGRSLAATGRSSLLICGYWLDEAVTFTSLIAMGEGYDVYLLTDASPLLEADGCRTATLRLVQAGVVPTTTRQAIREWAADTVDPFLRTQLLRLV